jgi:hypothetical protein
MVGMGRNPAYYQKLLSNDSKRNFVQTNVFGRGRNRHRNQLTFGRKMQQITSSTQAIEATAQVWRGMVDLVNDCKIEHGRGCVFYETNSNTLGYMSLFDLQRHGVVELEIDPDIFKQLLTLIGKEYDFHSEFVLLVKHEFQSEIKYVLQTGQLTYEGWRGVKSPEEIKSQERNDQLLAARKLREILARQRRRKK